MIHLQNLPHFYNDHDAFRFQRCTSHIEPLPCLGDFCERIRSSSPDARPSMVTGRFKLLPRIVK